MKAETEHKILNLCKGMSIAQAQRRLRIVEQHCLNNKLALRIKLVTLTIGN